MGLAFVPPSDPRAPLSAQLSHAFTDDHYLFRAAGHTDPFNASNHSLPLIAELFLASSLLKARHNLSTRSTIALFKGIFCLDFYVASYIAI